ncbi:MAG TPA: polysaccharide deacetylase family protein [Gemmatimonadaceae bacterium]
MRRRRLLIGAAVVVVLIPLAGFGIRALARAREFQLFGRLVAEVPVRDSLVALTLDDGPSGAMTDTVLSILRAHHATATFFVTGHELALSPSSGTRIVAAGHELGNHSYSHSHMIGMSPRRIRAELARTDTLIRAAGERGPIYFRPPYGVKLVGLPWVLWRAGRTTVMWSLEPDSYPNVAASKDGIVNYVLSRVRPGSILLLHVWYPSRATSRAALGPLVDSLHARGYRVVSVRELLAADSLTNVE